MREGWICPSCKRGVAPTEKHCDHGGVLAAPVRADAPSSVVTPDYREEIERMRKQSPWPTTTIGGGTFLMPVDPNIILMNLGH